MSEQPMGIALAESLQVLCAVLSSYLLTWTGYDHVTWVSLRCIETLQLHHACMSCRRALPGSPNCLRGPSR